MTKLYLLPIRDEDDGNTRTLKHGFRWGVLHGALDPETEKAQALWRSLDRGREMEIKEIDASEADLYKAL